MLLIRYSIVSDATVAYNLGASKPVALTSYIVTECHTL